MTDKKDLLKALAGFQSEVPVIHQGTQGYGYSYTSLPEIMEIITPLMKKWGLGFTQGVNRTKLSTIIFHAETGQSLAYEAEIPQGVVLKGMNAYQTLGSGITYCRRYGLSAALGLVTEKDSDATGEVASTSNFSVKRKVQDEGYAVIPEPTGEKNEEW